ncbi:flagellar motor switch protein FliN/FliY [Thermanaeromonas toyohensis ToBE]|uniref:Flagellar motor switch protein FliN/FliY n=1 Tax=Thermanaeromonas toyohensis ToBE TaxID=698762 RepID=A0A1W1VLQ4_9FIRM|nr:flagellar motor switch phosphatase FliY [Thermanaeromonas toyohensis]SMB94150.1 flagellar motor switch protein FliN/FliY [Thermanaeromonas toyohensis ToBE]
MSEFLSQEEIDALLKGELPPSTPMQDLTEEEKDALGEIGNISMGSAATALSQILNRKVLITAPSTRVTTPEELFASFQIPYMIVEVNFTEGLSGSNLLILKARDAAVIANLMMGGSGQVDKEKLDEIEESALGEAMNQMMGSAATSMSTIFNRGVKISPPRVVSIDFPQESFASPWPPGEPIVVVSFKMEIVDLLESEIMQVMPVEVAKQEVGMLLTPTPSAPTAASSATSQPSPVAGSQSSPPPETKTPAPAPPPPSSSSVETNTRPPQVFGGTPRNLELILDVPLDIEVVLGSTIKSIKEILSLGPGSIVELDKMADEPVEILVNGTLIAWGEVVVVNENFGVRITNILDRYERITHLRK